jgi:two-component system, OmpR family, sensor histidine kinase BaeS
MTALANALGVYYQLDESWAGIEAVLTPMMEGSTMPRRRGSQILRNRYLHNPNVSFLLLSTDGMILFSGNSNRTGTQLTQSELENATPIQANGEIVGWVLPDITADLWGKETPEGIFLANINLFLLFSAIGSAVVAVIFGGVLAYTMTRDLRELTRATKIVARGKFDHKVEIHSKDEFGELANSFNQMSAELAHSMELRKQMTANIAHDLRSPLSIILGYTEALNDGKLEPSTDILQTMHTEAEHLKRLIEDFKTLALADAGELPLYPQSISPQVLLQRVASAYRVQADHKHISLKLEADANLPEIKADVERIIQVLGNLIHNAIRHTPQNGEIILSGLRVGNSICFLVRDNGEGIPAEELPYVFERTFRGDKSRQQKDSEAGLGLAIARSLVKAQGGTISVNSRVGEGTTFTISLPLNS